MGISEENITDVVIGTLNSENARLNDVMSCLVRHLHAFIREVEPTDEEWISGIEFLTRVGQKCDTVRQEYILLSDTLGVTALKDCIANRKPEGVTEVAVLGPFYRDGAQLLPLGSNISRGTADGEECLVRGRVMTAAGKPVAGALIDVWQAADNGLYEQQDESQPEMNLRGCFLSDEDGFYSFRTVKPKYYPIPGDGPVGEMLSAVGRHNYRPAHIHFIVSAEGFEPVVTQIYDRQDPYIDSDAVFGVKESLVKDFHRIEDAGLARDFGVSLGAWFLEYDFVLNDAG
ncbi:6-chlorohydroxyquinol-1,2-dioxygenase [Marinobacterium nitratireducens]|uniref:6-chlorohydroxyquinol-1,2-dioxygenase n=1 Tax=Marinobacterium nitratireducens TaxID=518897 RepID=A0A917ZB18_9GAMM|nr:intradiol ring-cleavage dioxygenase [Marinobacterium nitratireducens]GGO79911.1 6-chlorohydroxyquinol-1,2-dioxygenase [Marinobacterium nitratireducens]